MVVTPEWYRDRRPRTVSRRFAEGVAIAAPVREDDEPPFFEPVDYARNAPMRPPRLLGGPHAHAPERNRIA